ncbi:MerC domain-containing protein [Pedobacter sp. KR3-3]|uniref:MerC domain-containing protein n=1 Tax=Pedobacter albus TaxID=3113905 RepID=A0ABU7I2V3_9SPHI|nr:MerC domain-containing protein [Pedobacter sp. KR3-3]MEE1943790.1 MerC domain-containing protein [Pedobacter sp. KR3-3]
MKFPINSQLFDKVGMSASAACAIHCALLPIVLTLLPIVGLEFLANPMIELSMIVLSLALACIALSSAYQKHRRVLPFVILMLGFCFIALGHLIEGLESYLIPLGGLLIAIAHFINLKLTKSCSHHIQP